MAIYPHMPRACPAMPLAILAIRHQWGDWRLSAVLATTRRFVRFWACGGAKFPKMGHSLPRTPTDHRAKFDAASFIMAGEICSHTNTRTKTVNDIPAPCLSACVDNNKWSKKFEKGCIVGQIFHRGGGTMSH